MLWKGKRENRPGKTLVNLDNPELSAFELLLSPSLWDIEHMRGSLLIFREITTGAPPPIMYFRQLFCQVPLPVYPGGSHLLHNLFLYFMPPFDF